MPEKEKRLWLYPWWVPIATLLSLVLIFMVLFLGCDDSPLIYAECRFAHRCSPPVCDFGHVCPCIDDCEPPVDPPNGEEDDQEPEEPSEEDDFGGHGKGKGKGKGQSGLVSWRR